MQSEKIMNTATLLGVLAGQISNEAWELIRAVRERLTGIAEDVAQMERGFIVPQIGEMSVGVDMGTEDSTAVVTFEGNKIIMFSDDHDPSIFCPPEFVQATAGEPICMSICKQRECSDFGRCWGLS